MFARERIKKFHNNSYLSCVIVKAIPHNVTAYIVKTHDWAVLPLVVIHIRIYCRITINFYVHAVWYISNLIHCMLKNMITACFVSCSFNTVIDITASTHAFYTHILYKHNIAGLCMMILLIHFNILYDRKFSRDKFSQMAPKMKIPG